MENKEIQDSFSGLPKLVVSYIEGIDDATVLEKLVLLAEGREVELSKERVSGIKKGDLVTALYNDFLIIGEVTNVDPESRLVNILHEEDKGISPPPVYSVPASYVNHK